MINGKLGALSIGDNYQCLIVGVVNISDASFYSGSIASTKKEIEEQTRKMIEQGAKCIDIGAQSTRPIQIYGGEGRVDEPTEEEMIKSALDVVLDITSSYPEVEVSIDTMRSNVARVSLNRGIKIINDISGLKKDPLMADCIGDFGASVVLMAAKKEPGDVYRLRDITTELQKSVNMAEKASIAPEKITIDPGIGSWEARDYCHDYNIIKHLKHFRILEKPVYVGISRKTSIGKILNDAPPAERLYGSIGATIVSVMNGVHVVRTHDVKPTLDAVRVAETIINWDNEGDLTKKVNDKPRN